MGSWMQNVAFEVRMRDATKTIDHVACTAVAKTQTFDFAAALPADAIVIGAKVDVTEAFTDGAACTTTCDVGIKGGNVDVWLDGVDLASIADLSVPSGIMLPPWNPTAVTPMVTIDCSANLSTLTAGTMTAHVAFLCAEKCAERT